MKMRLGYVTNSSSSSFIIAKKYLDEDQIKAIHNHTELTKKLGWDIDCLDWPWDIEENDNFITGYTYMDNFSMYDFLEKIGVEDKYVDWSEYPFNIDSYKDRNDWRDIIHEM